MSPEFLWPDWPAPANVGAAMSTRIGGASAGPYASFNLGMRVGDDAAAVASNRRALRAALKLPAEPAWLNQVHSSRVLALPAADGGEADASVTRGSGIVCVAMSADCLPVLLCDDAGTVVAAAHAGWRGLAAGVLEAAVRALAVNPASLMAWMGAAIGPAAFEVGTEVRAAFVQADAAAAQAFAPSESGRFMADLFLLARLRLRAAGVTRVYGGGLCTYCDATRFFSHRRDAVTGRMAALIWRA